MRRRVWRSFGQAVFQRLVLRIQRISGRFRVVTRPEVLVSAARVRNRASLAFSAPIEGSGTSSSVAVQRTPRRASPTRASGPSRYSRPLHRERQGASDPRRADPSRTLHAWLPHPAGRSRSAAGVFFEHKSRPSHRSTEAGLIRPVRSRDAPVVLPAQFGDGAIRRRADDRRQHLDVDRTRPAAALRPRCDVAGRPRLRDPTLQGSIRNTKRLCQTVVSAFPGVVRRDGALPEHDVVRLCHADIEVQLVRQLKCRSAAPFGIS